MTLLDFFQIHNKQINSLSLRFTPILFNFFSVDLSYILIYSMCGYDTCSRRMRMPIWFICSLKRKLPCAHVHLTVEIKSVGQGLCSV